MYDHWKTVFRNAEKTVKLLADLLNSNKFESLRINLIWINRGIKRD